MPLYDRECAGCGARSKFSAPSSLLLVRDKGLEPKELKVGDTFVVVDGILTDEDYAFVHRLIGFNDKDWETCSNPECDSCVFIKVWPKKMSGGFTINMRGITL